MRRRLLVVLSSLVACACSSAPEEVRPAKTPAPVQTAAPQAKAPRKLDGTPVVLALRQPTPVRDVEWAWLMPEGRLVTLAPANAKGERSLLGPNFFAGPNGVYVGLDVTGEFTLAADGEAHALGRFDAAAFDATGERLLVWNNAGWSLLGRDGNTRRVDVMMFTKPALLPDGTVIASAENQSTLVVSPEGSLKQTIPHACNALFPAARRAVCTERANPRTPPKTPATLVYSLDQPGELARFTTATGRSGALSFAVRADAGAIAIASDNIEVLELGGAKKASPRVVYRRAKDYAWRAPRMAFTADGKHLCVEEAHETRVLDPSASEFANGLSKKPPRGPVKSRTMCLFAARGPDPKGPGWKGITHEWDAVLVDVPVHEGYELLERTFTWRQRLESATVSGDRKTGALLEQKSEEKNNQVVWNEQAVVFDATTGAERRIVPLGVHSGPERIDPETKVIELTDDGKKMHVCASRLFPEGCRTFSTETGEVLPASAWADPAPGGLTVWSGAWPDANIPDVLAGLAVPVETKAKVIAWTDEGKYVSIEMDLGDGSSVHLNMPDTPEHVVRDVQPVAGGAMLAFASQGVVELWKVQPLTLVAVLVGVPDGGAAMFADGSVEAVGKGAEALGCQKGEVVTPIDRCGDVWAEKGTLLAEMKRAKNHP